MWESRRDFQRVWEGWEAGFLAFHTFHTLSFPWPAFRPGDAGFTATSTSAMGRTRKEMFVVIIVDECFGDFVSRGTATRLTDENRVGTEPLRMLQRERWRRRLSLARG
jgi:hypothetical protein